ncbi:hypothetical protein LB506_002856 [Fusarium annulatum]|nr:hypothetical protein LB506_002856 [Fusarium annulatum]
MTREDFPGLIPRPIMLYWLLLPLPVPLIRSLFFTYQMAAGQGFCAYPRLLSTTDNSLAFPGLAMTWPGSTTRRRVG